MVPQKIDEIYAWVATEADGGEGIPAITMSGVAYPLVGADLDRMEAYRPYAQFLSDSGIPVRLVKASVLETVEVLEPAAENDNSIDPTAP